MFSLITPPPHFLQGEVIKKQPKFLKDRLKDFISAKDLPFDF